MPGPLPRPFDVVTVPDFTEGDTAVFEARTLVFLASWAECGAAARGFPLHVACIGEPPASIRRLAGRIGASVTVHEPIRLRHDHHVGNKLRGLEVEPRTDRFLLLDVDIAILSGLDRIAAFERCIAACPEDAPNVRLEDWRVIYAGFDLPLPATIPPLAVELDLPRFPRRMMGYEAGDAQLEAMLPYYNGGVVFAPWDCGLRGLWEQSIRRIAGLFPETPGPRKWIHHSDQAALAVSIALLQRDGLAFRRLPDGFNARWQHLYAGSPPPEAISVMHCCWNFLSTIKPGLVDTAGICRALDEFFLVKVDHRFQKLCLGDLLRLRPLRAARLFGGRRRVRTVCHRLQDACRRHLADA
ncbi:MAG: hypothetical protein ACKO4Z_14520 [Planctomycetota bacterium]